MFALTPAPPLTFPPSAACNVLSLSFVLLPTEFNLCLTCCRRNRMKTLALVPFLLASSPISGKQWPECVFTVSQFLSSIELVKINMIVVDPDCVRSVILDKTAALWWQYPYPLSASSLAEALCQPEHVLLLYKTNSPSTCPPPSLALIPTEGVWVRLIASLPAPATHAGHSVSSHARPDDGVLIWLGAWLRKRGTVRKNRRRSQEYRQDKRHGGTHSPVSGSVRVLTQLWQSMHLIPGGTLQPKQPEPDPGRILSAAPTSSLCWNPCFTTRSKIRPRMKETINQ